MFCSRVLLVQNTRTYYQHNIKGGVSTRVLFSLKFNQHITYEISVINSYQDNEQNHFDKSDLQK